MIDGLVSVIIPCYRQAGFLSDCVRSLQAQTYPLWEALIIDDGSPDDVRSIAATLSRQDDRVLYLEKTNGGLSSARNAGIAACHGEYLQFLDADDRIAAGKLHEQVSVLQTRPDIDIVFGNAWYFDDDTDSNFHRGPYARSPDHDWIGEAWRDPRPMPAKLCDRNLFPVCAALARRSVTDRVGGFDESLHALEDWEFWLRCAAADLAFAFVESADTEALVRLHPNSMSTDSQRMDRAGFSMRKASLRYLTGNLRSLGFARLLAANSRLPATDRKQRFLEIAQLPLSSRERFIAKASQLIDPGGHLHPLASVMNAYLPRRLRNRLAAVGLSLSPRCKADIR